MKYLRISIDVIIDGDRIDYTNEEVALDANIFQHKVIALYLLYFSSNLRRGNFRTNDLAV